MNRDEYLHSCAKSLGRLTHEIKALNAIGRFDINSVAEDFLVPVLRILFACPDLQNQNRLRHNFPAVDLGSTSARISFQVTTNATSDKIAETIRKFMAHGISEKFGQLYIIALTEKQTSYTAKVLADAVSTLPFDFSTADHVLDLGDLLERIRALDTPELERVEYNISVEFARRDNDQHFRQNLDEYLALSADKIAVEKSTRKYIPAIFVETNGVKEEMRHFAHPIFFFRKLVADLGKVEYTELNRMLRLAREPEVQYEFDEAALPTPYSFAELKRTLEKADLLITNERQKIGPLSWHRKEFSKEYKPLRPDSPEWSLARFRIESVASGLIWAFNDLDAQVSLMRKKIFLITSMAGQGKTNFVCDLVERQFRAFEIPSIFVPARELNGYPAHHRLFGFISNNRYAPSGSTLHDYLQLFDSIAAELNRPLLFVIDGINEVTNLNEFRDELRDFCGAICQYDNLKIVITCRSEFFDDRYATLLNEPFAYHIHRVSDLRSKMSERSKDRLLNSYLRHFQIGGTLTGHAQSFLKNDLLLLRIFCERYANGDIGRVSDIYKGDLFEEFLVRRIEAFPENQRAAAFPALSRIVAAMLEANEFASISVSGFSPEERAIAHSLLADDIILREEIPNRSLSSAGDLVVSFTYDELRDFVIAYRMLGDTENSGSTVIKRILERLSGTPVFEGVYRYLYLLARKTNHQAAIQACEDSDRFEEHYALNVHLLPPAVQSERDIDRILILLSDHSHPTRLRAVAYCLVSRRDMANPLNISVLNKHLCGLDDRTQEAFVRILFEDTRDFNH